MEFKKTYSVEDLQEVCDWMRKHSAEMPKELKLDEATVISDLAFTIDRLFDAVEIGHDNPTYTGLLSTLFKIREKLLELNLIQNP